MQLVPSKLSQNPAFHLGSGQCVRWLRSQPMRMRGKCCPESHLVSRRTRGPSGTPGSLPEPAAGGGGRRTLGFGRSNGRRTATHTTEATHPSGGGGAVGPGHRRQGLWVGALLAQGEQQGERAAVQPRPRLCPLFHPLHCSERARSKLSSWCHSIVFFKK